VLCISVSNLTLGLVTGRASLSIGTCYAFDTSSAISLFSTFQCLYPTVPSVLCRCWLGDRKGIWPVKTEWWGDGMVVQTCIWPNWCHCHSMSLASVKSRLVLPFWYRLTRVVPEKGLLNGCVYVCLYPQSFSAEPCERKNQGGANETGFICTMAVEMWVVIFLSRVANSYVLMHNPSEIF